MMKICKNNGNKQTISNLIIFWLILLTSFLLTLFLVCATPSYAMTLDNKDIKWSDDSNTYKLTRTDNMITEKNYTVKVIEFPFAVRGYKTFNGSIYPERPVEPYAKFELYKDIINNTIPIDTFVIGIGEEYVVPDQETRITIDSIPGSTSQDWVYEYYNPWVIIKTQKRAIPNLDISISLVYTSGDSIDEDDIKPGKDINAKITIKNSGDDFIDNVVFDINPGHLLVKDSTIDNKLRDTIYRLNKDEEKVVDISLTIPVSLEEKEYKIMVNITGQDIKDMVHNFDASKIIKVKSDIDAIYVEKHVSKNTSYLKEYVGIVLNIVNTGHTTISNIRVHDHIPDRLIVMQDGKIQNYTELLLNKSILGPSESWAISYNLKPTEPGIYILPKFDVNFSIGDKNLSATAGEVGFRVFGPYIVLTKSARDMGNDIIDVMVDAKNVGNGPTRVVIEDYILPPNTAIISGDMNMTTILDPDAEKVMSYSIKTYNTNISTLAWSPAVATYYLDDWKFNTTSDKKYDAGRRIEEDRPLEGGTKAHIIILAPVITETPYTEVTVPKIQEGQKKVVATISRTPMQTPEKSIPGFMWHELILLSFVIVLLRRMSTKK